MGFSAQLDEITRQIEAMAGQTQQSLQPHYDEAGRALEGFADGGGAIFGEAYEQGGETLQELLARQEALLAEAREWFAMLGQVGEPRHAAAASDLATMPFGVEEVTDHYHEGMLEEERGLRPHRRGPSPEGTFFIFLNHTTSRKAYADLRRERGDSMRSNDSGSYVGEGGLGDFTQDGAFAEAVPAASPVDEVQDLSVMLGIDPEKARQDAEFEASSTPPRRPRGCYPPFPLCPDL